MSQLLSPHIGHHVITIISVKQLVLGWDHEKQQIIWASQAPEEIMKAVIDFVADHAEEKIPDS